MKKIYLLVFICFISITIEGMGQSIKTTSLSIGDTIPNITLTTMENAPLLLRSDYKEQPLVIIFYRANWCPFCNAHLSDMQPYFKPLMKLGYTLVAISTESVENLKKTKDNNYLRYTLLSDATMEGISKFGIANGNIAVPSVFIVDKNQVVKYLYTNKDYKTRLSGEEIFNKAKEFSEVK